MEIERPQDAPSLAAAAGTQVQSIIASAESAAAEIRRAAEEEAARTREQAIAGAREQLAAVTAAAQELLERVSAVDGALGTVLAHAQSAATELVQDLRALEKGVGELFAAARAPRGSPAGVERAGEEEFPIPTEVPRSAASVHANPLAGAPDRPITAGLEPAVPSQPPAPSVSAAEVAGASPLAPPAPSGEGEENGDVDGARLVALNMALGGESRADTERYLAEHFRLSDPLKLVDEVYAAIDA